MGEFQNFGVASSQRHEGLFRSLFAVKITAFFPFHQTFYALSRIPAAICSIALDSLPFSLSFGQN